MKKNKQKKPPKASICVVLWPLNITLYFTIVKFMLSGPLLSLSHSDFYAPIFVEVEGAYWFGLSVHLLHLHLVRNI